jgi:signal transduction histidine kinase
MKLPVSPQNWITWLRWPSFLVLFGFLSLYVFKTYKLEKDRIQKEAGLLFVNSIQGLETELMQKWIFRRDSAHANLPLTMHFDSVRVMAFMGTHESSDPIVQDSAVHIRRSPIRINKVEQKMNIVTVESASNVESKGAISIVINRTSSGDTVQLASEIKNKLVAEFDQKLKAAKLPVTYRFRTTSDSIIFHQASRPVGSYHDMAAGIHYQIDLLNDHWLALRAIWSEILLALIVLLCLALAFYSMKATVKKEQLIQAAKNDFVQNMTHELKTPLATVQVAMEGLHEFDGKEDIVKRDEYISIAQQELARLSYMIDRVLSISKLEKELPPPVKEPIGLERLCQEVIQAFKLQIEKQHIAINLVAKQPDIVIFGDKQWVSGIVYNLVDNAIKYSNPIRPTIEIQLEKNDHHIRCSIQDNGPGIATEYQHRIFEKFYRVPQGNIHNVKGHGLGLAFVQKLVAEMGGAIQLVSEQGKGSQFQITWPV